MDLGQFNQLIGAGGFGVIMASQTDPTRVAKFIRDALSCRDNQQEYTKHAAIYSNYFPLEPCLRRYINIPIHIGQPYGLQRLPGPEFECAYIMERLYPPEGFKTLVQLSLSSSLPVNQRDRVIGANRGQPVSANNPARGYFITSSTLEAYLNRFNQTHHTHYSIEDVVAAMGAVIGVIVFGANFDPRDVELVLAADPTAGLAVYALDFGLVTRFEPLHTEETIEDDEIVESAVGQDPDQVARDIWNIALLTDVYIPSIPETGEPILLADFIYGLFRALACLPEVPPSHEPEAVNLEGINDVATALKRRISQTLYQQVVQKVLKSLHLEFPADLQARLNQLFSQPQFSLDTTYLNIEAFVEALSQAQSVAQVREITRTDYPNILELAQTELGYKFPGNSAEVRTQILDQLSQIR
jgi:hypothetical protein